MRGTSRREVLKGAAVAALALGVPLPAVAAPRHSPGRRARRHPDGGLIVLEPFENRLSYQVRGAVRWAHTEAGPAPGQLNRPYGMAIAPDGLIAVANTGNDEVLLFRADGGLLARHGGLAGPRDVAWDARGRLAVVETRLRRVTVLAAGRPVAEWRDGLLGPVAVAFAPDGTALVADVSSAAVHRFAPDGRALGACVLGGRVRGVAVDDRGRAWVAVDDRVVPLDGAGGWRAGAPALALDFDGLVLRAMTT